MEENSNHIQNISVRSDLIGDYSPRDNLIGYKAEMFLKKVLRNNEEMLILYLSEKYNLEQFSFYLQPEYLKKYKKYLKDEEAKIYILEKYGEKQTLVDVLISRVTDLSAKECIRLKEVYEEKQNPKKIADSICSNYLTELRLILPIRDNKKKEDL